MICRYEARTHINDMSNEGELIQKICRSEVNTNTNNIAM